MWQSVSYTGDAQTHNRRFTSTELRHSSIAATWFVEQRRCTGRARPPPRNNWFWKTVFKITFNSSSNISVSCNVCGCTSSPCSNWFWRTVFKITFNSSSNISVSCDVCGCTSCIPLAHRMADVKAVDVFDVER